MSDFHDLDDPRSWDETFVSKIIGRWEADNPNHGLSGLGVAIQFHEDPDSQDHSQSL